MLDFLARAAMAGALSSEARKAPKAKPDADAILARLALASRLPAATKYPRRDEAYNAGMEAHLGCPMWRETRCRCCSPTTMAGAFG